MKEYSEHERYQDGMSKHPSENVKMLVKSECENVSIRERKRNKVTRKHETRNGGATDSRRNPADSKQIWSTFPESSRIL